MVHKLRSIDVWDTLLRRDCHPESIKLAVANHLFLHHRDLISARYPDPWAVYHVRLEVERELGAAAVARGDDDEYVLESVAQEWVRRILQTDNGAEHLVQQLVELELKMEIRRSEADPQIFKFLEDHPAEQTVFLSDFYMRGPMLQKLLAEKGFSELVPSGVVSCDVGQNKRSGRLYKYLHGLYGVAPSDHVHIGDNAWSDVEAARGQGVQALHYVPSELHAQRLAREALFGTRATLFSALREQVVRTSATATNGQTPEESTAFLVGAEAAPLFVGFALWIAEEATARGLDGIHFLTREGEFFHRVFEVLFPDRWLVGHEIAPAGVLELSRMATFAASLRSAAMEDAGRMWSLFGAQRVDGFLLTLGLDVQALAEPLALAGLKPDDRVENPASDVRLACLFQTPDFAAALESSIARQRASLGRYLASRGVVEGQRVGIVDVGWRGTIQDHLAALMPSTQFHGFYLGLRRFVNPQPPNVNKAAFGPDENLEGDISPLFESFAVLEMLCMAPGGSVVGFETNQQGEAVPVRQIQEEEDAVLGGFVAQFQRGVLHAAEHWHKAIERHALSSSEVRPLSLQVWSGLHSQPDRNLLDAFMRAPQQDFFGFGDVFRRNQVPSLLTLALAPIVHVRRRELMDFIRRVQWPAAVAGFSELGWLHRKLLAAVFRMANWLRRIRAKARYRG